MSSMHDENFFENIFNHTHISDEPFLKKYDI